ncbi:potassium/sodium hyperpolarization-activated cyclic nucleotide-gated channel 2-like [Aplochiton taeniatus]
MPITGKRQVTGLTAGRFATALQFIHMIVTIILVCHWNACFQFLVAAIMDFPNNSWVVLNDLVYKETMEFMRHRRLPRDLRHRVIGHLENCYQGRWFDEKAILMDLSEPLKREVVRHNCVSLVSSIPMFKDTNTFFISELLMELQLENYQNNDLIIRKGDQGDCMYFIERGTVKVQCDKDILLSDGDFFGEMCLITGKGKRNANVLAVSPCRLYSLSYPDYRKVLKHFPELEEKINAVAKQRAQKPVIRMT